MSLHSKSPERCRYVRPVKYESSTKQDSNYVGNDLHTNSTLVNNNELRNLDMFSSRIEIASHEIPIRSPTSPYKDVYITTPTLSQSHRFSGSGSYRKIGMTVSECKHQDLCHETRSSEHVSYDSRKSNTVHSIPQLSPNRSLQPQNSRTSIHLPNNSQIYEIPQPFAGQAVPLSSTSWPQDTSFYDCESTSSSNEPAIVGHTTYTNLHSIPPSERETAQDSVFSSTDKYLPQNSNRSSTTRYDAYSVDNHCFTQPGVKFQAFQDKDQISTNCIAQTPRKMESILSSEYEIHRHPELRPLPSAPIEDDDDDDEEEEEEKEDEIQNGFFQNQFNSYAEQEQLFEEIGETLNKIYSGRETLIPFLQKNGDIPEIQCNTFDNCQAQEVDMIEDSSSTKRNSVDTVRETYYDDGDDSDDSDDESDFEAAAGLEAMRIADEEDLNCTGISSFGNNDCYQSSHQSIDDGIAHGNEELMDLSSASGDHDYRISYGENIPIKDTVGLCIDGKEQNSAMQEFYNLQRSESYGSVSMSAQAVGLTGLLIKDTNSFSAIQTNNIESFGAIDRQSHTSNTHRLSFDEGDEHVPLYSRSTYRPEKKNLVQDRLAEQVYHPGTEYPSSNTPNNIDRPLPLIPADDDSKNGKMHLSQIPLNRNPNTLSFSRADQHYKSNIVGGPDLCGLQNLYARNSPYIYRASSLLSQGTVPYSPPPVRSKTDAEERQLKNKAARMGIYVTSGLEGHVIGSPLSLHVIDLPSVPAGRLKKFSPSRLSSEDFRKCKEPWALSCVAGWIRQLAGGDSGEGEPDLKTKTIEEGFIALFTHFVPTMNVADAETLSQRILRLMLDSGLLVREEEWVKFGSGEISGVFWQLTGSGCYSPKVHEYEMHGRCYSYHCTRTLKKINLQTKIMEPSRNSEDWMTFHKLTKEKIEAVSKKEVQRQNNLHEIIMSEDLYMDQINILRVLYRDELSSWEPPIIAKEKLPKFVSAVFGKVQAIKAVNESYLLAQLKYRQKEQGPWIIGFSDIFREWIRKAKSIYIDYAAGFPHACFLVRRETERNLLFRQFLNQARDNKLSGRLDWNTYLKAPITRLQRYSLLLSTVLSNMTQDTEEKSNLVLAIEEIKTVTHECDAKVDENCKKVEMLELRSKLILRPGMDGVDLNLDHMGRKLIFQGDLLRAGANRFTWLETHAILLDNYLILAKTISKGDSIYGRKRERYDVSKHPIPMQLLVLESTNDDPVVKSSVKGITAVTAVTKTTPINAIILTPSRSNTDISEKSVAQDHTVSNQSTTSSQSTSRNQSIGESDNRLMYPFRVKHLGKTEVFTLYAPSAQNRIEWCDKILEAKTQFTASLHKQNAEPFKLRVIADFAFALESLSVPPQKNSVTITGTPLDRAIREMEKRYGDVPRPGPTCRAQVNCATAFSFYGKSIMAIGTDCGVYVSIGFDPRGWARTIQVSRVTQIAVLEEFSICLIIADKSLIAYPLDMVLPASGFPAPPKESARHAPIKLSGTRDVSFFATSRMKNRTLVFYKKREGLHSTFKVLEPIHQKSSEKKSRLLGKFKGGTTEFFRPFDDFYIPTECYSINLFHSYIAISTLKGFELMTLDKKVPMSIPDAKDPAIASITARLVGQKPLGMFRLSSVEFLLCYEECGVYIDKHGDVSRSVVMEFVGKAKTAAMYGAYLVLFDTDFIEIRNADNGRLRQVIAGKDIKCLDSGTNPLGTGVSLSETDPLEDRTLKFVMVHPEMNGNRLVLEMELSKRYSE